MNAFSQNLHPVQVTFKFKFFMYFMYYVFYVFYVDFVFIYCSTSTPYCNLLCIYGIDKKTLKEISWHLHPDRRN